MMRATLWSPRRTISGSFERELTDLQYHAYELAHAWITPMRAVAQGTKLALDMPFNPLGKTLWGRQTAAACDLFEGLTRRYGKPAFGLDSISINGEPVAVTQNVVLSKPFATCCISNGQRTEAAIRGSSS